MQRIRIVIKALAIAAAAIVAAAAVLWGLVRTPWFEDQVSGWLGTTLGTPVAIERLAIGYLPSPSVEAGGVAIAADNRHGSLALVEIGSVRAVLPWRSVLGGPLRILRLELEKPLLRLAVDAGGRGNWESLVERLADLGGDEPADFVIDAIGITEGTITYADARGGSEFEVTAVTVTCSDVVPRAFFPADLRFAAHGSDAVLHGTLRGEAMLDPDRDRYAARAVTYRGWLGGLGLRTGGAELAATVALLEADLASGIATLEEIGFDGLGLRLAGRAEATDLASEPQAAFRFVTEPFAPRAVANSLNRALPDTADTTALARAVARIDGRYAAGGLVLARIEAEFDDTRVEGEATVPVAGPPRLRLSFDRIDLDRYRPAASAQAGPPQATVELLLEDFGALDLDADLRFGEARAAGAIARGLRVVIEPNPREAQR